MPNYSNIPDMGTLVGRRLVGNRWYGLYQVPESLMTEDGIMRCEDAGMETEFQRLSHFHDGEAWWVVHWKVTIAIAYWEHIDAFMSLPEL